MSEAAAPRFTVVGCGTVVPEADRSCSAFLLEAPGLSLLMDCGPGTVRALARVGADWAGITDVWISHFHTDHIGDVPGLLWALTWGLMPERRRLPLTVWGPAGTAARLESFAAAAGGYVLDPGFPVEVRELAAASEAAVRAGWSLRTLDTPHTDESLALRLDSAGAGSVVYTGDTGPALPLGEFAAGADLFVCECSLPEDLVADNHLSPASVARFAAQARPGTLLLTHVYPQFRAAADVPALVRSAGFAGEIELAEEGWSRRFEAGR